MRRRADLEASLREFCDASVVSPQTGDIRLTYPSLVVRSGHSPRTLPADRFDATSPAFSVRVLVED